MINRVTRAPSCATNGNRGRCFQTCLKSHDLMGAFSFSDLRCEVEIKRFAARSAKQWPFLLIPAHQLSMRMQNWFANPMRLQSLLFSGC